MKINNHDVFEQVGNLFYSIAADQHVKPLEVAELKLLISKDWLPRNLDANRSVVSDETHVILVTMDNLQAEGATSREAFGQFSKFYARHPDVFTNELKQRILNTAAAITKIFKADNPFDNTNLIALQNLFKGINVEL